MNTSEISQLVFAVSPSYKLACTIDRQRMSKGSLFKRTSHPSEPPYGFLVPYKIIFDLLIFSYVYANIYDMRSYMISYKISCTNDIIYDMCAIILYKIPYYEYNTFHMKYIKKFNMI